MYYIFTADSYLWLGLSDLLSPFEAKWLFDIKHTKSKIGNVCAKDVFVFDASVDPTPLYIYIKLTSELPHFIFIGKEEGLTVTSLLSSCDRVNMNGSLSHIRDSILEARNNKQISDTKKIQLSPREARIVVLSIEGASVRNIAAVLGVTAKTIYAHRTRACRKLGVGKVYELLPYKKLFRLIMSETEK